ncbi:DUF4386 domain-containing protein [Actinoplanes subtropicus]|uniref:DUF4386 domain-containing protein n=1 Tax=Actinoplanes subtropicus TaxID=543632 RepID=UPI00146FCA55|nr:DUF4386 domain-containing protein [Actinoplanes subtropicus]
MNSVRRISIVTGVLFVLATVTAVIAGAVVPALGGAGALSGVAGHPGRLGVAAVLYLMAAGTSVGIAVALYPLLREVDAGLALGSVIFRTIEAVCYAVAVVGLLAVRPLAERWVAAPAGDRAAIQTVADSVVGSRDYATLVGVLAFCAGALMYYLVFYRARLVPRWLSGWGLAGVLLMAVAGLLALFSDNPVTGYTDLILPIAVQEMVLAVWLLAKGFRRAGSARQGFSV